MIDNLRHASPSPEINCRRNAFSHTGTMADLNEERAVFIPQKRLNLIDEGGAVFAGDDHYTRRMRTEEPKKEEFLNSNTSAASSLTFSSPPSNKLVENEIIVSGSSSYIGEEDRARENKQRVTCWSHGSISVIGRRREMEDAVAIQLGFLKRGSKKYDFFGVYDGHGGSRVAHACRERLHRLLVKGVGGEESDHAEKQRIDWEKVMEESFRRMDEEVCKDGSLVAMMGSTAVVAVVGEEELVVANCGDSRAVLSRGGVAIALSDDHKPERTDELERIEACGGKVIDWNGHRVLGVLATSRSIGDYFLKPFVISEPEVRISQRTNKDELLILASDGLWDVIPNDVACQIARTCLDDHMMRSSREPNRESDNEDTGSRAAQAAATLGQMAIARGSGDNISVIVIELKRFRCGNTS